MSDHPIIGFLGCTHFSEVLLESLVDSGIVPRLIFTIPEEFTISYSEEKVRNSNYSDLGRIAKEQNIPLLEVDSVPGKRLSDYGKIIEEENIEILLVLGWYYMVPKHIRELCKYGSWGIHASLLPDYAGGAPLNWAIINGEKETGVTLFRMEDGVDDGDIIAQKKISIEYEDSIAEVYKKAELASIDVLKEVFSDFNNVEFKPQDKSVIKIYPQRSPEDGEIDQNKTAEEIYNFVRAQSAPYPGAYIRTVDGKKVVIEKARVEPL